MYRSNLASLLFDRCFVLLIAGSTIAGLHWITPANVAAQNLVPTNALPTTVQLPSFSQFYYSGSVLVPTGGSASLGSVSRSSSGRSSQSGFAGRAAGAQVADAGASVHVTIIDHDAIDRQIRGLEPSPVAINQRNRTSVGTVMGTGTGTSKARPLAALDPDVEGKALVRFARKQFLAGHHTSAFDAYQLAIETLTPALSTLAEAEFQRVFPAKTRPVRVSIAAADPISIGTGTDRRQ